MQPIFKDNARNIRSIRSICVRLKNKNAGKANIALPAFSYIIAPYGHQFSLNRCARNINPQHQPPSSFCELRAYAWAYPPPQRPQPLRQPVPDQS